MVCGSSARRSPGPVVEAGLDEVDQFAEIPDQRPVWARLDRLTAENVALGPLEGARRVVVRLAQHDRAGLTLSGPCPADQGGPDTLFDEAELVQRVVGVSEDVGE